MKRIILALILLITLKSFSQTGYIGLRQNGALMTDESYVKNSPGNTPTNSKMVQQYRDSIYGRFLYPTIRIDYLGSSISNYISTDIMGNLISNPITSIFNPSLYYSKTIADGKYLQSFTEIDPTWVGDSSNYYKKLFVDLLISGKLNSTDTTGKWKSSDYVPSWSELTGKPSFSTVALSGLYSDLSGLPTIPSAQVNSDWTSGSGISQILNKPSLSTVAISGDYSDLLSKPYLFSGVYSDLTGKPTLFDGDYFSLSNRPTIPAAQINSDWNASTGLSVILNKPILFSGSYSDLTGKPSLFSGAYSDLTGKPTLFSGSYLDLTNKPTIPSNTNQLTNGSGFITGSDTVSLSNRVNTKFSTPTGTSVQYLTGAGVPANFPMVVSDYFNTGTTTSGVVIFYLTSDKTSTGTALYTSINYVNPIVNDVNVNYTYGWTISSDKKTLTVTSKSAVGINVALLGLTLLGAPTNVPNGTSLQVLVKGN